MENSANTTLTVYGKPACVQCTATERWLKSRNRAYEKIDVTMDEEALEYTKALGYLQAPVVVTSDGSHWSGFDPDRLALYV